MAREKIYNGNVFNDLCFLIGLGKNPYRIKLDRWDIFPYVGLMLLFCLAMVPRVIIALPTLVFGSVGRVVGKIGDAFEWIADAWIKMISSLPFYPVFFNRFRNRLWEKYQARLDEKLEHR